MKAARALGASSSESTMPATLLHPAPDVKDRVTVSQTAPSFDESVLGMEFAGVVGELVAVLGGPNVALIGGVRKTSLVAEWMRGSAKPKTEDRAMRLRLALRLARIIGSRFPNESVRAWFWGANRRLEDEAPIAVITELPLNKIQKDLLGAARGFVQI